MSSSEDFDWAADESIAVQCQPATAVYTNALGQVVIRQERDWNEEHDGVARIARDNVLTIVAHMLRAAEMYDIELIRACKGGGYEDVNLKDLVVGGAVVEPYGPQGPRQNLPTSGGFAELEANGTSTTHSDKPKDRTGAARQRRYRQRKRNASVAAETVTPHRDVTRDDRDTVTEEPELTLVAAE